MVLLCVTTADGNTSGGTTLGLVKILVLGGIESFLGVLGVDVNLHRLQVRGRLGADKALVLAVSSGTTSAILGSSVTTTLVAGGFGALLGDLASSVLRWLGLSSHC